MESTGLIPYYKVTLSIKTIVFYQMVTSALNDLSFPDALLYDAPHGVLLNATHR